MSENNKNKINTRILSLDVFRGLTIILMIIVNSPGTTSPYSFLDHAVWDGCTLADLVFPAFLYIVGMSLVISLKKQMVSQSKQTIYKSILQRTAILFGFGLILNIIPNPINLETIRFYGILQRIALCYGICALIYLHTNIRTQIVLFMGILLSYWILMTQVPVPGFGANQLTMEGNWASYMDQLLFSPAHLFGKVYDPEGAVSTLPSIATTMIGIFTAELLETTLNKHKKSCLIALTGIGFLILGWLWSYTFPINKNLWTSSFVLWAGGFSLITFAWCYWIIDIKGYTTWTLPFKIFGMNALFAFIFHVLILKLQALFSFPLHNGTMGSTKIAITHYLFGNFGLQNAALLYSLLFLIFNFLVVAFLYQRKVFIRI